MRPAHARPASTRPLAGEGLALVVLDLAGTTVRDDGQVPAALSAALAAHGVTVGAEAIRAVRGAAKRDAIRALLPASAAADRVEAVYAAFRRELARRFRSSVQAVPGAEQGFAWLRQRGVRVALNTGFDRETTEMLLQALDWSAARVDAIVCGDEVPRGRPAPDLIFRCMATTGVVDVARVANVGDTVVDLQAGHHAGVRYNLAVVNGAHPREVLAAVPHSALLASVADLPRWLLAVGAVAADGMPSRNPRCRDSAALPRRHGVEAEAEGQALPADREPSAPRAARTGDVRTAPTPAPGGAHRR